MNIFLPAEARHYCAGYKGSLGASQGAPTPFVDAALAGGVTVLREGTPQFDEFRDCSLRNVERLLFLAASQYRRAADLMFGSSASWAHVTLYYGAFYGAGALLGMFGGTVLRGNPFRGAEVQTQKIGSQALKLGRLASTGGGSHQNFWSCYYTAMGALQPWVGDTSLHIALTPIGSDPRSLITKRNELNYDSHIAVGTSAAFLGAFRPKAFPLSLPGELNTQYQVFEAMLRLACAYAAEFGISTDALDKLGPGTRREKIRKMVFLAKRPAVAGRQRRAGII